jgi:hypothetical protein
LNGSDANLLAEKNKLVKPKQKNNIVEFQLSADVSLVPKKKQMHVVLSLQERVFVMTSRLLLRSSETCIKHHPTPSTRGNFHRHAATLHLLTKAIQAVK